MRVVVDTGNGGPTLFPLPLLDHATDVRPIKVQISGITPESILAEKAGKVSFEAPLDPSGTAVVQVEGVFVDIPEVLISRKDLPEGFEITRGTSNYAKAALRSCPEVILALDNECSAIWTLKTEVPKTDSRRGEKNGTTSPLTQPSMSRLGLQSGEEFLHRACVLVHNQLGHPCPKRTHQSMLVYGIQIPLPDVENILSSCRTCRDKAHNSHPVTGATTEREGLVEQDLTQFPFEGVGKEHWISVIYDMHHRYIDAMPLKCKGDATLHTAQYLAKYSHVKRWRVDNAPELNGKSMKTCLTKHGVALESTAPASSWSNGGVERANQTLKNLITTLMVHLGVEGWPEIWPWFITAACHAHNSTYNEAIKMPPLASISGKAPNIDTLFPSLPFGRGVLFSNLSDGKKRKNINKKIPGIFLAMTNSGSAEVIEPEPSQNSASRHIVHPRTIQMASDETEKELLAQLKAIARLPEIPPSSRNTKKVRLIRTMITFDPEDKLEWVCTSCPYNSKAFALTTQGPTRRKVVNLGKCENQGKTLAISDDNQVIRVLRANGHYLTGFGYVAHDEASPADVNAGLFREADAKEWNCIIQNNVLGRCMREPPEGVTPIRTRFRRIYKSDGRAKTRFVVCATHDNRPVPTTTHLPLQYARRVCHLFGLCNGWKAASVDVQTAFLLVPLENDVYIRLPQSLPPEALDVGHQPGGIYKLNRALYGLKESPRLFQQFMDATLEKLMFTKVDDGVFLRLGKRPHAVIITYVDDVLCWSSEPVRVLEELRSILPCADVVEFGNHATRYVGEDIVVHDVGVVAISMASFIRQLPPVEDILHQLPPSYNAKRLATTNLPLPDFSDGFFDLPEPEKESVIERYRSLVGSLGWIASAHPSFAYRFGELARYAKSPGIKAFRIALECLREATKQEDLFTEITPVSNPVIRIWTDANLQSGRSRRGWCVQILDADEPLASKRNIIAWKSAKDDRAEVKDGRLEGADEEVLHHSSVSAETFAIYKATQEVNDVIFSIRSILKPLFPFIPVQVYTDSKSGVEQILNERGTKTDRIRGDHIRAWMKGVSMKSEDLRHGSGRYNMADPLTKPIDLDWYTCDSVYFT